MFKELEHIFCQSFDRWKELSTELDRGTELANAGYKIRALSSLMLMFMLFAKQFHLLA